jgi:hypothetical protein
MQSKFFVLSFLTLTMQISDDLIIISVFSLQYSSRRKHCQLHARMAGEELESTRCPCLVTFRKDSLFTHQKYDHESSDQPSECSENVWWLGLCPRPGVWGSYHIYAPSFLKGRSHRGQGSDGGKRRGGKGISRPRSYKLTNRTLTSGLELGTSAALAKTSAVTQLTELSAFVVYFRLKTVCNEPIKVNVKLFIEAFVVETVVLLLAVFSSSIQLSVFSRRLPNER